MSEAVFTGAVTDASAKPAVSPWIVAGVVTVATFMEVLDTSVANVALPHIAGSLSSSYDESTWALTSYLVANALIIPVSGWIAPIMGRKNFLMLCVALFTLSSALCGMAESLGALVFFRVLQGLGGGGLQPCVQAVLMDLFPGKKRGMAMAFYVIAILCAPVLGPTLGGWITENYSWRWIFYINVPIGLVCLFLMQAILFDPPYLVKQRAENRRGGMRIDFIGLALLSVGLAGIEIIMDKGQQEDWFGSRLIVTLAVIVAFALPAAALWEWYHRRPIVNLRLLKERNFLVCCCISGVVYAALFATIVLLPQMMQTLMGYSPLEAGLILSPAGMFTMALVPFVGMAMARGVDARILIGAGLFISGAATLWMSHINLEVAPSDLLWPRVVQSMGVGLMFVPLSTIAFSYLPPQESGNASALFSLVRNEGSSIGVAIVSTLLARGMQTHRTHLVAHVDAFDPAVAARIESAGAALGTADPHAASLAGHALVNGIVERQSAMLTYLDQFRTFGLILIALIPLVFLLKKSVSHGSPMENAH